MDRWCSELGKTVIAAGLSGDFQRKPFANMSRLIALADQVQHLTAVCGFCKQKDAAFTFRLNPDVSEQLVVGGADMYLPACRGCFQSRSRAAAKRFTK